MTPMKSPLFSSRQRAEEILLEIHEELVGMLQSILDQSGFGSVTISIKKDHIDELGLHVTAKPRANRFDV